MEENPKPKKEKLQLVNFYIEPESYKIISQFGDEHNISYGKIMRKLLKKGLINLKIEDLI